MHLKIFHRVTRPSSHIVKQYAVRAPQTNWGFELANSKLHFAPIILYQFLQASARQKPVSKRLAHFFLSLHTTLPFSLFCCLLCYAMLCCAMLCPVKNNFVAFYRLCSAMLWRHPSGEDYFVKSRDSKTLSKQIWDLE